MGRVNNNIPQITGTTFLFQPLAPLYNILVHRALCNSNKNKRCQKGDIMQSKKAFKELKEGFEVVGKGFVHLCQEVSQDLSKARYNRCKKFIKKYNDSRKSK